MSVAEFGNDRAKIASYLAFWDRLEVRRPLIGFTLRGWLPLEEYQASRSWSADSELTPDMLAPENFLNDEINLLREGEHMGDDILRGVSPACAIVPWLEAMMGSELRVLSGSVVAIEKQLPWSATDSLRIDYQSPWCKKYFEFADALVRLSEGRFPVSHSALNGPSDLMAAYRGRAQSIIDLIDEPELSHPLLQAMAEQLKSITAKLWKHLPLFFDGFFDSMYELWAPGPILRMQEDASALYSPSLYQEFLQPIDRELAKSFPNAFVHLHSTSMMVLEGFLEIDELKCIEINYDISGPSLAQMIPYFQKVQSASKSLLIRGSFTCDELLRLLDSLEARGLMLLILVKSYKEADRLRAEMKF
jgi:hypothetical protein